VSILKPYKRTVRPFASGSYFTDGHWRYITHQDFAIEPERYIHAFMLIQRDLFDLFDFVEPDDVNRASYSHRIHSLLMLTCIEVEANCKAILAENGYVQTGNWTMADYRKIERSHMLSAYEIRLPRWRGTLKSRTPFGAWIWNKPLHWYQTYNSVKHDRHNAFASATLEVLTDAIAGLVALLASQFGFWDFSPSRPRLVLSGTGGPPTGFEEAIGGQFQVRYPSTWPNADRYDFDWEVLSKDSAPIGTFAF
jgi:hypothetical protein